jgi:YggT family protein
MDIIIIPLLKLILTVLSLYGWAVFIMIIMSWLTAFNILNGYNRFVFLVSSFLFKITEPPLRVIRKFIPNIAGIDLSPMVLILAIWLFQEIVSQLIFKMMK